MPFPYSPLPDRACLSPDFPLPLKEAFRNDLRGEDVDEEEWQCLERAKERWRVTNFRGFHDLYLATDVLALADCLDNYAQHVLRLARVQCWRPASRLRGGARGAERIDLQ